MAEDFDLSLLDKNLSDIEDLPSFEVPPKGTYVMLCSGGTKKIGDHPAVVFDLEVVDVVQLANENDPNMRRPKTGDKTGVMFMLDNEFGLGNLKQFLAPFAAHFKTDNVRSLVMDKVQNCIISCTMDHQPDKTDKSKIYARPKNIVVRGS